MTTPTDRISSGTTPIKVNRVHGPRHTLLGVTTKNVASLFTAPVHDDDDSAIQSHIVSLLPSTSNKVAPLPEKKKEISPQTAQGSKIDRRRSESSTAKRRISASFAEMLAANQRKRSVIEATEGSTRATLLAKEKGIFREVGNPSDFGGTGFWNYINGVVIHPLSLFRRFWDAIIAIAVLYTCWEVPFDVAFNQFNLSQSMDNFGTFLDVVFCLDIVLNFRTGFISHGLIVMDPKKIALEYGRSWFLVDLIASIPGDWFFFLNVNSSDRKSLTLIKYFKIPKLLRIGRVIKFFAKYAQYSGVLQVMLTFAVCAHLGGCGIALLLQNDYPFADHTIPLATLYTTCLRYAVSLLLGHQVVNVGKESLELNLMSFALVICGIFVTTLLITFVILLMMQRTSSYSIFRAKVDRITKEMEYYGLPMELQERIQRYYKYLWVHQTRVGSHSMYQDVSLCSNLRSEIALFLHKDFIEKVPLFKNCSEDCLAAVIFAMKTAVYLPDDWIVKKGEVGRHLFVIRIGAVAVTEDDGTVVTILYEGAFFGELALLMDSRRTISVRAIGFCELSTLSKDNFTRLLVDFPQLLTATMNIAEKRRSELINIRKKKHASGGQPAEAIDNTAGSPIFVPPLDNQENILKKWTNDASTKTIAEISSRSRESFSMGEDGGEESNHYSVGVGDMDPGQSFVSSETKGLHITKLQRRIEEIEAKLERTTVQMQSFFKVLMENLDRDKMK